MELVAAADVKARAQARHGVVLRLLVRDRVVGQRELHEVIEVDVALERQVAVPDIEAVACRRAREVDADTFGQQLALR